MRFANDHRLFRTLQLACLAAALAAAGCKGPDASSFSCTSSRECPGDYHCDLGTATTAGSLKCASGAPVAKTLTVDATKFLLLKQPSSDGTVRTTISAAPGAVTSTPDFVGVRVVASQSSDLASSPAQSDGSAAVFQLPQAVTQVSLRVQDDSGHFVAVTGYPERVVMNFEGKDVAGNTNPIAAYDAATGTDSLFDPAAWIGAGVTELPASSPITNSVATPAAYNGLSSFDGISSATAAPPQPTATGPIGWERITNAATATIAGLQPSPRSGAAIAQSFQGLLVGGTFYTYIFYGGLDASGTPADSTPTVYAFNQNLGAGWTTVPVVTSTTASPFPSRFLSGGVDAPVTRANASMGPAGPFSPGTPGATNLVYSFFMAGGTDASGARTNKVYAFGDRVTTSNGNKFTGWWDESVEFGAGARLAVPNAGMASASLFNVPVSQGPATAPSSYAGMVLVGGEGNTPGAAVGANDSAGCQFITSTSFSTAPTFQVSSCTADPSGLNGNMFLTTTGGIGFRTGVALTNTDNFAEGATVYLFGGNRTGATTAGLNGLQNDLWKGTIAVVCNPANASNAPPPCTVVGATAVTQITWSLVATAAGTKPSPRAGAVMAFGDPRKLVVYGGTDGSGLQQDLWELDVSAPTPTWRRMAVEPTPALAPVARSKAIMLGAATNGGSASYASAAATLLFGGTAGTTLTNDVWVLSRQAPPRLLIKAPVGISSRSQVTNASLSITAAGTLAISFFSTQTPNLLYAWDGSAWQFVGAPAITGNIFASPQNAMSYVQADGNIYLMLMSRFRATPTFASTSPVQLDGLEVTLDFQ